MRGNDPRAAIEGARQSDERRARIRSKPVETIGSAASALDVAVPLVTEAIEFDRRKQYAKVRGDCDF